MRVVLRMALLAGVFAVPSGAALAAALPLAQAAGALAGPSIAMTSSILGWHGGGHAPIAPTPKAPPATPSYGKSLPSSSPGKLPGRTPVSKSRPSGAASTGGGTRGASGRTRNQGGSTISGSATSQYTLDGWEVWWELNFDAVLGVWVPPDKESATRSGGFGPLTGRGRAVSDDGGGAPLLSAEIVPTLQRLLRTQNDQLICDSAVMSLGRVCGDDLAPFVLRDLRAALDHPALSVQTASAVSLGVLGAPAAFETLVALAGDTSEGRRVMSTDRVPWQVRAYAALGLGLLGNAEAVDPLLELITRSTAAERDLRACAVLALGLLRDGRDRAGPALISLLREGDDDDYVAAYVPVALAKLGEEAALPSLLALLEDEHTSRLVRQSAAIAVGRLGRLDQPSVVEALLEAALDASDAGLRHFAFIALGKVAARTSMQRAPEAHEDLTRVLRQQVARPDHRMDRSWAALAAGIYGLAHPDRRPAFAEQIREAYDDEKDPSFKGAFAVSLGMLRDVESGEQLHEDLLESDDDAFRGYAGVALGLLGHDAASEDLITLVTREGLDGHLRLQIARGLAFMRASGANDALLAALEETDSSQTSWTISRALGRLRDARSLWPLIALSEDEDTPDMSRAFAGLALGFVGEKTELRWTVPVLEDINYLAQIEVIQELYQL